MNTITSKKYWRPIIFDNEIWKDVTIPNVLPYYKVSNYGNLYSSNTDCLLDGKITDKGYIMVKLRTYTGYLEIYLHRLVMLTFNPIPNPELYIVNHLDGIKSNDFYENLEWATQKRNVEHAFQTGLRGIGENSNHNIFTDEQVHRVCKCMELGYTSQQISQEVFGRQLDQQLTTLYVNIFSGKFWSHISSLYNIKNYRKDNIFSEVEIHNICKMLSDNNEIDERSILANLGFDPYNMEREEYLKYYRVINAIRNRKRFNKISNQYKF